jgi:hypothetical protein
MSAVAKSANHDETVVLAVLRSLFAGRSWGDGTCYEEAAFLLRDRVGPLKSPSLFGLAHAFVFELATDAPRPVDWRPISCRCASADENAILSVIAAAEISDPYAGMTGFNDLGYARSPDRAVFAARQLAEAIRDAGLTLGPNKRQTMPACRDGQSCAPPSFQTLMKDLNPC